MKPQYTVSQKYACFAVSNSERVLKNRPTIDKVMNKKLSGIFVDSPTHCKQ